MKSINKLFVWVLTLSTLLTGCAPTSYLAKLDEGVAADELCPVNQIYAQIDIPGDEDFQIYRGPTIFLDLRHQGMDKGSVKKHEWAYTSRDRQVIYAKLISPAQLSVDDLDSVINQRICVKFKPPAFIPNNVDDVDLSEFLELKNQVCCGILIKKLQGEAKPE